MSPPSRPPNANMLLLLTSIFIAWQVMWGAFTGWDRKAAATWDWVFLHITAINLYGGMKENSIPSIA